MEAQFSSSVEELAALLFAYVWIPDLKIKRHGFYHSQPAKDRERTQVTLGSWPGSQLLRDSQVQGRDWGWGDGARLKEQGRGEGWLCVCVRLFFLFLEWGGYLLYREWCLDIFLCLHHFLKINMKLSSVSCSGALVGDRGTVLGATGAPKLFCGLWNRTSGEPVPPRKPG